MYSLEIRETLLLAGGLLLSAIVFGIDLLLPLGIAGGVMHVPVVLIALWLPGKRYVLGFAAVGTVLTAAGYFWSPSGTVASDVLANRLLAVLGIWLAAFVAVRFKENREALYESEARNQLILDAAAEGIIVFDEAGIVQSVNCAAEQIFGRRSEKIEGRPVDLLFADPDQMILPRLQKMVEGGAQAERDGRPMEEFLGRREDGTTFPLRAALSRVELDRGRLYTAFVRDITARRRLERKLIGLTEEERQQIGYDLHEGVGQTLNGIKLLAENLASDLEEIDSTSARAANRVAELLNEADGQVAELIDQLTPVNLAANELTVALDHLVEAVLVERDVDCTVTTTGTKPVRDNTVVTHLYRIAQEALTNAIEHGRASHLSICLHQGAEEIRLAIEDDGTGFRGDVADLKGMGIRVMEYRARLIGAALYVGSALESGTVVECRLPREHVLMDAAPDELPGSAA